jgi:hypothetical protein
VADVTFCSLYRIFPSSMTFIEDILTQNQTAAQFLWNLMKDGLSWDQAQREGTPKAVWRGGKSGVRSGVYFITSVWLFHWTWTFWGDTCDHCSIPSDEILKH